MPQVTVTTIGTRLLGRNPYRKSVLFHNQSANTVHLQRTNPSSAKAASADFRIPSGGNRTLTWIEDGQDAVVDEWSAVAETGDSIVVVAEFQSQELARLEKLFIKEVEK